MTDEDFAVVDFVLTPVDPVRVAFALAQAVAQTGAKGHAQAGQEGKVGLLSRLTRRIHADEAPVLTIHASDGLPPPPLARLLPDDLGYGSVQTPFRITAPVGSAALTLLEFREADGETSPLCEALSSALPETDLFRFRLSGARHPGSETAFHVYRDGRAVRRTASVSAEGTAPEADWHVTDTGIPHGFEAESLPGARARAWEIMTPERQGAILAAMGVQADLLFEPAAWQRTVVLSSAPGGTPLSGVESLFAAKATDTQTRPVDASDADAPEREMSEDEWETEVTALLLTAVNHALPEPDQVPWLLALTAKLEAGEVEAALSEAQSLIERGQRPLEEKAADAARLDALFGVTGGPER